MGTQDDGALPRGTALMWGLETGSRRGPKPGLTIREIGAAAARIADDEGLGAVSMGRVATALGFTTMSLYRYVDSKVDLVTVMVDEAYGPPDAVTAETGWRAGLTSWSLAARERLLRHPWILQVPITEPPSSPHQLAWLEKGLRALRDTGLTEQEKLSSILLVDVYVRGQSMLSTQVWSAGGGDDGGDEQGASPERRYAERLARVLDPQAFPHLVAALASGALEDDDDGDDDFAFGLDTILSGVERRIEGRIEGR